MAEFARCSFAKTTANCFNFFCHFHLIQSASRSQRHLVYDCIYFSFPSKNFLGALFIPKVPLETGAPPPPNFLMLPTHLVSCWSVIRHVKL
jgi:hypothetical protein